jgi:hypothetical protein
VQDWYSRMKAALSERMAGFDEDVVVQVHDACKATLGELDKRLCGIRDGIITDETAESRKKVSRCVRQTCCNGYLRLYFYSTGCSVYDVRLPWSKAGCCSCRTQRELQEKFPIIAMATSKGASATQAGLAKEEELSYAMAAARRTEKRRIVSFVCLCDFIIASTLRSMLLASAEAAFATACTSGVPRLLSVLGPELQDAAACACVKPIW